MSATFVVSLSLYSHKGSFVLEIGAGMGENTKFLLATEAKVCATDISEHSLSVIEKRFNNDKLTTKVADMEKLPFAGQSFDIIVSAGSLSYGDNDKVLDEIYRVLKNKGAFIAIDSLNNNPIYRLNRYLHYLKGERSLSTIARMPDLKLLLNECSEISVAHTFASVANKNSVFSPIPAPISKTLVDSSTYS
jgi:ubiquinone/menaquinone biosynthesis C-methylase UbiE